MINVSEQIIKQYCDTIEDRVAACCDKQVAQYLRQIVYREVEQKCDSGPVLDFVKKYIDNLIQMRFHNNNNN